MTKPKPARELTTEGALRRLFPKEVRAHVKQLAAGQVSPEFKRFEKLTRKLVNTPKPKKRGSS